MTDSAKPDAVNIIATLGPASNDLETIKQLRLAGANCFRLNFSHGSHEDHKRVAERIRQVDQELGLTSNILADLQGPKLRIGTFKDGEIQLKENMEFQFDLDPTPGDETRVCLPHKEIIDALEVGSTILLDDGNVYMEITETGDDFVKAKVLSGHKLSNNKGVNVPDVFLSIDALTDKDIRDLNAALDIEADYIAVSFVQSDEDVRLAKSLIKGRAQIISKIEKPQALALIEEIIDESDGIMVARGDLGVEIPLEYVPGVQREIIRQANEAGKFVIVATHMLDSMIDRPRPTRAEANDVSSAVRQGADAVMLSAETAVGKDPVQAVTVMKNIYEAALLEMNDKKAFLRTVFQKAQDSGARIDEDKVHKPKDRKLEP